MKRQRKENLKRRAAHTGAHRTKARRLPEEEEAALTAAAPPFVVFSCILQRKLQSKAGHRYRSFPSEPSSNMWAYHLKIRDSQWYFLSKAP